MKRNKFVDGFLIIFGCALAAFGFHFFLDHANLVTGGCGGIGIVISHLLNINTSFIVLGLNIICLISGLIFLGKDFFIKTVFGSLLYPVFIYLYEELDLIFNIGTFTDNMILIVFMSSLCAGTGIGLVLRSGGSTGGLDVFQMLLHKITRMPFSACMYILDGIVVFAGMLVFGIEQGLFSIVVLLLNGVVIDKVIFTNSKKVLNIITSEPDKVKEGIYQGIDRGVTVLDAEGGFSGQAKKMLLCVIDSKEYTKVMNILADIDKTAFVYITPATEVSGRGFSIAKSYKHKEA